LKRDKNLKNNFVLNFIGRLIGQDYDFLVTLSTWTDGFEHEAA